MKQQQYSDANFSFKKEGHESLKSLIKRNTKEFIYSDNNLISTMVVSLDSEIPQIGYEGGILDSVELLVAPAMRIEDLFVRPNSKTGNIHIQAIVHNTANEPVKGHFVFTVAPTASGETLNVASLEQGLEPGDTLVDAKLQVKDFRLWDINDPYLYRVTARAYRKPVEGVVEQTHRTQASVRLPNRKPLASVSEANIAGSKSFDEQSTSCGFRNFRFENGYFRLNGRRLLLKGTLHMPVTPISGRVPYDPAMLRLDLLQLKVMGFNMVRFIAGIPRRFQLDLADEIGLMVYEESFASWLWEDSPKMPERFDNSTVGMIKRDRNHPSIVMWGLLNENFNGELLLHAVKSLP